MMILLIKMFAYHCAAGIDLDDLYANYSIISGGDTFKVSRS